jgi:hypothetical protein
MRWPTSRPRSAGACASISKPRELLANWFMLRARVGRKRRRFDVHCESSRFAPLVMGMPQHYGDQIRSVPPPQSVTPAPSRDNSATIALFEQWARDDATDDPAAVAQAQEDLAQFKAALNANRSPDRLVFP